MKIKTALRWFGDEVVQVTREYFAPLVWLWKGLCWLWLRTCRIWCTLFGHVWTVKSDVDETNDIHLKRRCLVCTHEEDMT